MASDASFVEYVVDQVNGAGAITTRFMFGEYALYCNEKVVALICDNKLFVKPTEAGRAFIGTPVEAPAYTGAKPSFLIEDKLEDRAWLTELIRITEREVSAPAKKAKNKDLPESASARPSMTKPPAGQTAAKKSPGSTKKTTPAAVKNSTKKSVVKPATSNPKRSSKTSSGTSSKQSSKNTTKTNTKKIVTKSTQRAVPKTTRKAAMKSGGTRARTATKKNVRTKTSSRR